MKKIVNIINEEISGFITEVASTNLNANEKAIVNDILSETLDEAVDLNKALAKIKRYAAKGLITTAIFMALASSNVFGQRGMEEIKHIIDTSRPKTELVGTQTANMYWQGRSYQRILDNILKQGGLKIYNFHEGQSGMGTTLALTLDSTDFASVEKTITNVVKSKPLRGGNYIVWDTMRDAGSPDDGKGFIIKLSNDNDGRVVIQFNSNFAEPQLVNNAKTDDFKANPDYLINISDKL